MFKCFRHRLTRLAQRVKCRVVCLGLPASIASTASVVGLIGLIGVASVNPVYAQDSNLPEITIYIDNTSVKEGEGFVIEASANVTFDTTQTIFLNMTIPAGYNLIQHTSTSNVSRSGFQQFNLQFPSGVTPNTRQILTRFSVLEDERDSPNGLITINAMPGISSIGSFTIAQPTRFSIAVSDNDLLSINPVNLVMNEGETESLTLTLSEPQNENVEVFYITKDDTATERGLDYVAKNGTVIFAPRETEKNITISTLDNPQYNPNNRRFFVEANTSINGKRERVTSTITIREKEDRPKVRIELADSITETGRGQNVTFTIATNGIVYGTDTPIRLNLRNSTSNLSENVAISVPLRNNTSQISHTIRLPAGERSVSFTAQPTSSLSYKQLTIDIIAYDDDPYTLLPLADGGRTASVEIIEPEISISANTTSIIGGERVEFTLSVANGFVSNRNLTIELSPSVGMEEFRGATRLTSPDVVLATLPAYANNLTFSAVVLGDFANPLSTLTLQPAPPQFPEYTLASDEDDRQASIAVALPAIGITANPTSVTSGEEVTFTIATTNSSRNSQNLTVRLAFSDGVDIDSASDEVNKELRLQSLAEVVLPRLTDSVNFTVNVTRNSDDTSPYIEVVASEFQRYDLHPDLTKQKAQVAVRFPFLQIEIPPGRNRDLDLGAGDGLRFRITNATGNLPPSGTPNLRVQITGNVSGYLYNGITTPLAGGGSNIIDLPWPLNAQRITFDVFIADEFNLTSANISATLLDGPGYEVYPNLHTASRGLTRKPILSIVPPSDYRIGHAQAQFGIRIDNDVYGEIGSILPINLEVAGDVENILRIGDAQGQISVSPPEIVNLTIEAQRATIFGRLIPVGVPQNPTAPAILRLLPAEGYAVNPNASIAYTSIQQPTFGIRYLQSDSNENIHRFFIDVANETQTAGRNFTVPIEVSGNADARGQVGRNGGVYIDIPQPTPTIINVTINTASQGINAGDRTIFISRQPGTPLDPYPNLRLLPGLGYHIDPDASEARSNPSEPIVSIATNATAAEGGELVTFTLTNNNTQNFTRPRSVKVRLDGDAGDILSYTGGGGEIEFSGQDIEVQFSAGEDTANFTIELADFPTGSTITATLLEGEGYLTTSPTTATIPILKPTLSLTASKTEVASGGSVDYVISHTGGENINAPISVVVEVTGGATYTHLGTGGRALRVVNGPPAPIRFAYDFSPTASNVIQVVTNQRPVNLTARLLPSATNAFLVDATANNVSVRVALPEISIHGETTASVAGAIFNITSNLPVLKDTPIAVDINGRDISNILISGSRVIPQGQNSTGFNVIFDQFPGENHITATLGTSNVYNLNTENHTARVENPLPIISVRANTTSARPGELVQFIIESDKPVRANLPINIILNRTIDSRSQPRVVDTRPRAILAGQTSRVITPPPIAISPNDDGPTSLTVLPGRGYRLDPDIAKRMASVDISHLVVELSANRASIGGGQNVTFTIKTQGGETSLIDRAISISIDRGAAENIFGSNSGGTFINRGVTFTSSVTLPAGRPSASFTIQAQQVTSPSEIDVELTQTTGYQLSASPARRRVRVPVTAIYEPILDIVADKQVVVGSEDIAFTINTPLIHDPSLDPTIEIPTSNTPIMVLVDGDLTGYTYAGSRTNFASTGSTPATPATIRLPWQANAHQISFIGHVDASPDTSRNITATILDNAGYDPHPNSANATARVRVGTAGSPLPQIAITANTTRTFKHQPVAFTLAVTNGITPLADVPILITHSEGVAGFSPSGIARNLTTDPTSPVLEVTLPADSTSISFNATISGTADGGPSTITLLDQSTSNEYNLATDPDLHQASIAIVKPQFIITNITSSIREGETLSDMNSHFRIESVHGPLIDPVAVQVELAGDNDNNNLIEFRYTGNANPSTHIFTSPYVATLNMSATRHAIEFGVKIGTSRDGTITARLLPPVLATPTSPAPYVLSTNTSHNSASIPIAQPEFTLAVKDNQTSVEGGYSAKFVLAASHAPLIDPRPINLRLGGAIESYTFAGNTTPLPPLAVGETRDIAVQFGGRNTREELSLALVDNPDNTSPISVTLLDGEFYDPAPPPANISASIPVVEPVFGLAVDEGLTPREAGESVNITIVNHNMLHLDRYAAVKLVSNKNAESWRNRGTLEGDRVRAGREFTSQVNFLDNATSGEANHVLAFVVADDATGAVEVELRDNLGYRLGEGAGQNTSVTIPVRLPRLAISANTSMAKEKDTITYTINATNGIAPRVNRTIAVNLSDGFDQYTLAGESPQNITGNPPHPIVLTLPAHASSVNFTARIQPLNNFTRVNATLTTPATEAGYTLDEDEAKRTASVNVEVPALPVLGVFVARDAVTNDQDGVGSLDYEESVRAGEIIIRTINGSKLPRNISVEWRTQWQRNNASFMRLDTTPGRVRTIGDTTRPAPAENSVRSRGYTNNNILNAAASLVAGGEGIGVPLIFDANDERDVTAIEVFTYRLVAGTGYVIDPMHNTATINLHDDDPAIAITGDLYANEGGAANIRFAIVPPATPNPTPNAINYRVHDPNGVTDVTNSGSHEGRIVLADASSVSITIPTKDDSVLASAGDNRSFAVEILDSVTDGYRLADGTSANQNTSWTISVLDNDVTLAIDPAGDVNVNEGDSVNFTISIDQAQPLPVIVSYTTQDNTAMAGRDYDAMDTTLTFQPGETTKTITLTTLDNNIDVNDNVQFSLVANATINGANRTATRTITIIDNDRHPEVTITADKNKARRGENITFTITSPFNALEDINVGVRLTPATSVASYTLTGSPATALPTSETIQVVLPNGQTSVTFTAQVSDSPNYNSNIMAELLAGDGYGLPTDPDDLTAEIEVLRPPPPEVGIYIVDASGNEVSEVSFEEGQSDSFALVIRTANSTALTDNNIILWQITQPTSPVISAIDHPRAYNGIGRTGGVGSTTSNDTTANTTLTGAVAPQATNIGIMLNVTLTDNSVDEAVMRELVWRLTPATSAVNNYTIATGAGEVRVRLYDNDPAITLGGDGDVIYVNEGDTLHIPLRVEAGSATSQPHQIIVQASDPLDLVAGAAGRITVPLMAGRNEAVLVIDTNENEVVDAGNRNFTLEVVHGLGDGYGLGSRTRQTIVVRDDDAVLSLTPTTSRVDEGEAVTLQLAINQPQPEAFNVTYATAAGTGLAGVDYEAVNASVTFQPGETSKTISVQTLNNTIDVLADVSFSVVANMTLYGVNQTRTALVAIADDDNSFDFTLTPSNVSVAEGTPAQFTLTLSNPLGGTTPFIVSYATNDGTAQAGVNYEAVVGGQVEFQPGETSKTITLNTLADAVHTHGEDLRFMVVANATRDGAVVRRTAGVNVTESSTPPVLTLALSAPSVNEGGRFVVSADSDRQSSVPLSMTFNITTPLGFSVTDRSQSPAVVYTGGSSVLRSVKFPANTTSHQFADFLVVEDTVNVDANGVFSVRAIPFPDNRSFVLAQPDWLNITLVDNDDDPVVGLTASTNETGPGEVVTFTIDGGGLATTGARQVVVDIMGGATSIYNGSHNFTHDYESNATTNITIAVPAGGGDARFSVTAVNSGNITPPIEARLVNGTDYAIHPDRQSASVNVLQNLALIARSLGFDADAYHVMEGDTARVRFEITPPPVGEVFLNYATADGSGVAGTHYEATEGRVRFAAGEGNKTIAVPTIQNVVASEGSGASVQFAIHANVILNGVRRDASRNITISDEDEMPLLSLQAAPRVRVGQNATVSINSNRTKPPLDRVVMVEIDGASVEAVYSLAQGSLVLGGATNATNGVVTEGVVLPKENLSTAFVVQARDADNLTPIVVRLLNGTGYMVHPDPSQQQAVILVQQRSGLVARDINTAILPQVVGALLDEVAGAVAGRSHAFFGDGGGGDGRDSVGWQRLTIGGESIRSFAENYARGEARREAAENPWDAPSASRLTQVPDVRLLRFNLAFGGRSGGADGLAVWGQGFSRGLSGKYSPGGVEFEGDVPGRIIGIERRVRQSLLLGVGFSDIAAKFDYTRRDDAGDIARGRHETDLSGYHPYLAWRLAGGGHVWATIGVSEGEVVIRQNGVADVYRSEVEAETASIGFNTLADGRRQADGSAVSLNFEGDVSYASITETPTRETRDAFLAARAIDLSVARVRIGGVISKHSVLDSGGIFRQSLRLAVRHDSGDILEGGAVELGASASLELVRGLTIDLSVRTLLFHEESLDELGLRGRIAWSAPDANGRGLQLVLAPRWGNTESQSDALLDGGYHYYAEAGSDGDDDARYAFDIRYGIPVFRGGLLTPFITGDAGDIAGASYGGLFTYGDFAAGIEAVAGDEGKAFSRYSRDF